MMPRNTDPFQPWNDPMHRHDSFAPHNDRMDRDNPFKAWNDRFGREEDMEQDERDYYQR